MSRKQKDTRDNLTIIRDGLLRFPGWKKQAGDWTMVQCPFHDDKTPSCGVYTRIDNPLRELGTWNCLGCGEHGRWNRFAEKAGLDPIVEWQSNESSVGRVLTQSIEDKLLGCEAAHGSLTLKKILKDMGCPEAQPWITSLDWRGFSGEFISKIGGLIVSDDRNNDIAVLFPIQLGRRYVGGVKAIYEKRRKEQLGYVTMPGPWVEDYGLFPYNIVKKMLKAGDLNFVILVEGPRDALRLISLGIPALAVLGANTFGKRKALHICNLGIGTVYALTDNDNGGNKMWRNVKRTFDDSVMLRRLKLPVKYDSKGKVIKMDPFSAPQTVINNLKKYLKKNNGWKKILIDNL